MPPKIDRNSKSKNDSLRVLQNCKCAEGTSAISCAECDAARPNYRSNSDPLLESAPLRMRDHWENSKQSRQTVRSSRSAAKILRKVVSCEQEELWLIALCPGKTLLALKMIFRGTATACVVHPRDIFRELCRVNAAAFILGHNHPSQNPTPSTDDWIVTKQLVACAQLIQIPMLDHIVVTNDNHRSMAALNPSLFSGGRLQKTENHFPRPGAEPGSRN